MRIPSYRRVAIALSAGAMLALGVGATSASAQTACTVCLSPSGEIYDGRTTPYSAVPPPQPTELSNHGLLQQLLLQQLLVQQLQQQSAPPPPPPVPTPAPLPPPAVSPNDRYSTSNGVKTANQIQTELLNVGYSGPFDVPSLLAAYQRTTTSPVRPI